MHVQVCLKGTATVMISNIISSDWILIGRRASREIEDVEMLERSFT